MLCHNFDIDLTAPTRPTEKGLGMTSEEKSLFMTSFSGMFDVELEPKSLKYIDLILNDATYNNVDDYLTRRMSDESTSYLMPYADVDGDKITLPPGNVVMPSYRQRSATFPCPSLSFEPPLLSVDDTVVVRKRSETFCVSVGACEALELKKKKDEANEGRKSKINENAENTGQENDGEENEENKFKWENGSNWCE